MDGIDGIAGGQAFVAGLGWAVAGFLSGNTFIMFFGLLIAASSLGFLFHNWSPAKIFMGDVGSAFLGYTFAVLPLIFASDTRFRPSGLAPFFAGILLLWPFIFDSIFTLLRRLRLGENVFQAHRSHLYQRLVVLGYSHKSVSLLYSALAMVGVVFAAGWAKHFRNISALVVIVLPLLCVTLWSVVTRAEQKKARTPHAQVPTFADPT
jgi:UDP-N-acetylmuramyl pentapeptide phosphotransferase/UDP-N-acetylglucosamine-1-phosphate transferase